MLLLQVCQACSTCRAWMMGSIACLVARWHQSKQAFRAIRWRKCGCRKCGCSHVRARSRLPPEVYELYGWCYKGHALSSFHARQASMGRPSSWIVQAQVIWSQKVWGGCMVAFCVLPAAVQRAWSEQATGPWLPHNTPVMCITATNYVSYTAVYSM